MSKRLGTSNSVGLCVSSGPTVMAASEFGLAPSVGRRFLERQRPGFDTVLFGQLRFRPHWASERFDRGFRGSDAS